MINNINNNVVKFNLQLYLKRIKYNSEISPTKKVLHDLHLAHATNVPFENLDVYLRKPVMLDIESLQNKIVVNGRGGYCFEQNLLFAQALESIGFNVKRLSARVRLGTSKVLPRTHMLMIVNIDNEDWLADVGFGGDGLLLPIKFKIEEISQQFNWKYKIVQENNYWVLQSFKGKKWEDLYAFTLEKQELADYELANYYTSTHPDSKFVKSLTIQITKTDVKKIIKGQEYFIDNGNKITKGLIKNDAEFKSILKNEFKLIVSDDVKLLNNI